MWTTPKIEVWTTPKIEVWTTPKIEGRTTPSNWGWSGGGPGLNFGAKKPLNWFLISARKWTDELVDELLQNASIHGVTFEPKKLTIETSSFIDPASVSASLSLRNGEAKEVLLAWVKTFWNDEIMKGGDLNAFGFELPLLGMDDVPSGRVPVTDRDEGHGPGVLELLDEELGAEEAGGSAQGHDVD